MGKKITWLRGDAFKKQSSSNKQKLSMTEKIECPEIKWNSKKDEILSKKKQEHKKC